MSIKFLQLEVGRSFRYQGRDYLKVGPLLAEADGERKIIPRAAEVEPLEATSTTERDGPGGAAAIARTELRKALEAYFGELEGVVEGLSGALEEEAAAATRRELERAQHALMQRLGL